MPMFEEFKEKTSNHVSFVIYDFECLPDEITKKLGIEPTETRIKGEIRIIGKKKIKIKRVNKENSWHLKSDLPLTAPVENHLVNLLKKLKPRKQKITEINQKYYAEFSCALYFREANPGIHIDEKLLKEIGKLNAKLDLDMYCLGDDNELESTKAVNLLTKLLSKVKFISQHNTDTHNEPKVIVNSLKVLEDTFENFNIHLWDLCWGELSDEQYKTRFEKIGEDLKKIIKAIKQSKFLNSLIYENSKDKK